MNRGTALLLKSVGLRATPKRVALLRLLSGVHTPLSAEELHRKAGLLDLVTVYRNLQDFTKAGIAREVRFKDGAVRYESAAHDHHHHLVCNSCGVVEDVTYCPSGIEETALRNSKKFTSVESHAFELFGTCTKCA